MADEFELLNKIAPTSGFMTFGEFYHDTKKCKNTLLNTSTTYITLNESETEELLDGNLDISYSKKSSESLTLKAMTNLVYKTSEDLQSDLIQKSNELAQQSKMAAMGEMINNIAHQWRQPLSIITTVTSGIILKRKFGTLDNESIDTSMNKINNTAQHLSKTIDDFRNFFNPNKCKIDFNLNDTVTKALRLLEDTILINNIVVIKKIDNISLFGLENELIQVFINIINNAKDELIKLNNHKRYLFIDIFKNKSNIEINITDNAGGILQDSIGLIFDSYYTTKENAKGTGIGLYMSKTIIKEHMNGKIEVSNLDFIHDSINYSGASFKITLPFNQ